MSEQRVTTDELIVLLDAEGRAAGTAPKALSHHESTPLHLAFSCYLTDDAGRVLITQRAHGKTSFPSVWTNSCCGHPAPGERLREAVRRRVDTELGLRAEALTLVLPDFRYRATAANGLVENELCPVVRATAAGELRLHPDEVAAADWRD
ncbi:isopentenyl-diphosphate Delta-isomerase, partial [Actinoallomurus acaciae]